MPNDINTPFQSLLNPAPKTPVAKESGDDTGTALGTYDDQELLELWGRIKKESINTRTVFERQWMRNIYYVLGRQWIEYQTRNGGWRDKRMAQWIPRPVTNKCKEVVQAIRAMLTAIRLGVNVRPNGSAPQNVSAAATADELAPLIHEVHEMNSVLSEFYFWLIVTGNAFIHTFVDYDIKHGMLRITYDQCVTCGAVAPSHQLTGAQPACPECGGQEFTPALDDAGEPVVEQQPKGRPTTIALSPLELAFPNSYSRFSDLPYVVRLRWRPKLYFENHPELKKLVSTINWQKSPNDQSLQLYKSLATHNDLGISPVYWSEGMSQGVDEEGVSEYEIWYKPCDAYPDGLVFRVIGDSDAIIAHLEETEALPGPLPYKDADGNPLFTFTHAGYEHVGGRVLASGALDPIIQKQDQINQLDSLFQLIIQRVANPVWLKPKGANIVKLTGMPGLVIEWDSLTVGGNAKPERIAGEGPHQSLFVLREQYLREMEELSGTFDIIKGQKPTGIEAFSALQLLVERSQSRFAPVFGACGDAYKNWFKFAIELEREFGPNERTKFVFTPARRWTWKNFQRTQLQGSISVVVEDGSTTPKTSLGMRAAVEHATQLKMLNMQDPDQQYEGLKLFGLTRMIPTLDIHIQAALRKQQAFEEWVINPEAIAQAQAETQQAAVEYQQQAQAAPGAVVPPPSPLAVTPLKWRMWYNPIIHKQEFLKWANSDRIQELLETSPQVEGLLTLHLQDIDSALFMQQQQAAAALAPQVGGQGQAMNNSNRESTSGNEPKGQGQGAQTAGPA